MPKPRREMCGVDMGYRRCANGYRHFKCRRTVTRDGVCQRHYEEKLRQAFAEDFHAWRGKGEAR